MFSKHRNAWFIDSSGLIDTALTQLVKHNFTATTLIISDIVLDELQQMADQSDTYKRGKARRALSSVVALEQMSTIEVKNVSIDLKEKDLSLIHI